MNIELNRLCNLIWNTYGLLQVNEVPQNKSLEDLKINIKTKYSLKEIKQFIKIKYKDNMKVNALIGGFICKK